MRILVAGKGFIGSQIGENLSEEHEVKYLDRSEGDYQQDITKMFSVEEEFDLLIHTIGLAPGFATEEAYQKVHVQGTENLMDAVNAEKVVYISALEAGEIDHPFFHTKKKAEEEIGSREVDYTIIRPSTVYGEGNKLLDLIRAFSPLRVFPDIKTETQPIHQNDLVEIIAEVAEDYRNKILTVGGPEKMTIGEMAMRIYREEGRSCLLVPFPDFLIELKLTSLSFLGMPFSRENMAIIRSSNTTENNDAKEILAELKDI